MKNKKTYESNYITSDDIINLLLFENTVLQKKINNQDLTPKEKVFDSFIVSPSSILRDIIKSSKLQERK